MKKYCRGVYMAGAFFATNRMAYFSDFAQSEEYKALVEASDKSGEIKGEDTMETRQKDIYDKAGVAIGKREKDYGAEMKKTDADHQKQVDEKLAAEKPEPKNNKGATDKDSKEWKEWKAEHNRIWGEIKVLQQDAARKKGDLTKEFESDRANMYSLRDTAVKQLGAAFETRKQVQEKIMGKIMEQLGSELDPEDREEIRQKARFAADLADDGTLTSFSKEVSDYLDSTIGGKKLSDSEVEGIAMGIASVLHDKDRKNDPENPARKFIAGLAEKEKNSGEFWSTDDRGVRINDVQRQILQNLGYESKSREDYQDAKESDAGKLVADIASSQELSASLRGMLLGRLAGSNKENRDAAVKDIRWMYEQVKAMPDAAKKAGEAGFLASIYSSEAMDEKALEGAGAVFIALEDALHVKRFQEAAALYRQQQAITGASDPDVEKIIAEAKSQPAMRRGLQPLTEAIRKAEEKFRTAKLKEAAKNATVKEAEDLYKSYGLESPYKGYIEQLKGTKDKPQSLSQFVADLAAFNELTKSVMHTAELQNKAMEKRDAINEKIAKVRNYQETYAKHAKNPAVKKLPEITGTYEPIASNDPKEINDQTDKLSSLDAAAAEADENAEALASATTAPKGRGRAGGGAGAVAGGGAGAPSRAPSPGLGGGAAPGGSPEPVAQGREAGPEKVKKVEYNEMRDKKYVSTVFDVNNPKRDIGLTSEQKKTVAEVENAKGGYADVKITYTNGESRRYAVHVSRDGIVDRYYPEKKEANPSSAG